MNLKTFCMILLVFIQTIPFGKCSSEEIITVTQHTSLARAKRDLRPEVRNPKPEAALYYTNADFPPVMKFTVHMSEGDVALSLEKHVSPEDINVSDENGAISMGPHEGTQYAIYQDAAYMATMTVECKMSQDTCRLTGSFYHNAKRWKIEPTGTSRGEHKATESTSDYKPSAVKAIVPENPEDDSDELNDIYIALLENPKLRAFVRQQEEETPTRQLRERRNANPITTTENIIEFIAVADWTMFNYFLDKQSNNEPAAETELTRHLLVLFAEVDLRYKGLSAYNISMRVFLRQVVIEKNVVGSFAEADGVTGYKNAAGALFNCAGRKNLYAPDLDVGVCFSKNKFSLGSLTDYRVYGYSGILCYPGTYKAMISEDNGDDQDLHLAHGILGTMSIPSDGSGDCDDISSTDAFVGSELNEPPSEAGTETNPWKFSNCSREKIAQFLSTSPQCLRSGSISDDHFEAFTSSQVLSGKIFSLDDQCKFRYGNNSEACVGANETSITSPEDICWKGVYCSTSPGCVNRTRVLRGSPCGCKKSCIKNECVRDFNIPLGGKCDGCCECADPEAVCDCATKTCQCRTGFYNNSGTCAAGGDCGCPPQERGGEFSLNVSGETGLGATASLTCNSGFVKSVAVTITCSPSGWSAPSEKCKIECNSPWEEFGDSCYLFGSDERFYNDASEICNTYDIGGLTSNLVEVNTEDELNFLKDYMSNRTIQPEACYFNDLIQFGPDEALVKWASSGDNVTVTDWLTGQPDNVNEACTAFTKPSYQWSDIGCDLGQPGQSDDRSCFMICELKRV